MAMPLALGVSATAVRKVSAFLSSGCGAPDVRSSLLSLCPLCPLPVYDSFRSSPEKPSSNLLLPSNTQSNNKKNNYKK